MNQIRYSYNGHDEIRLYIPDSVFSPTDTTAALIQAVESHVEGPGKLLDLGCGSGVTGIVLNKIGLVNDALYASDVSVDAVKCAEENARFHNCQIVAKCGSLLEPWEGEEFDYIVDDISGVAEEVAKVSPWFHNVPCQSGPDGSILVTKVITESPDYLNKGGALFFPVISLSNVNQILSVARDTFSHVERLSRKEWPLPKDMYQHMPLLRKLQAESRIELDERFGMVICYTEVFLARM